MFALIRDGKVAALSQHAQTNHSGRGQWINVAFNAKQPKVGWNAQLFGSVWNFSEPALPLADIRPQAMAELVASDQVALRCLEAGHPVPADWIAYRAELRAIVKLPGGTAQPPLPPKPGKPPEI